MSMKKIGVVGSGQVGETLANGFLKHGHEVMRGARDPSKLAEWKRAAGDKAKTETLEETARFADVAVLAVKGAAAEEAVLLCSGGLDGKVVIDATNPIADKPPTNGVIAFFTGPNDSLLERIQQRVPKAFSSVGAALMVNPKLPAKPTMFICGNDADAKEQTRAILDTFGWETEDAGAVEAARAIEPLCMLWCIPGFLPNDWTHAFKVLR
jgi:predicted dinucleotide-binding enzyme